MEDTLYIRTHSWLSPVGELLLGSYHGRLCLCLWSDDKCHISTLRRTCKLFEATARCGMTGTISSAISEMEEFFNRNRKSFETEIALAGTAFQRSVWQQLLRIPYGGTKTYAQVAVQIGHPTAMRAVANAIATNPISIFVPCHRVIGSNHALTGYAGGLAAKKQLLEIEMR